MDVTLRRLRQDPVFQSEHLGPFREGTLWRTRGQEITDSGVYQVEAEDPEGHPWLMSIIVAESYCLGCRALAFRSRAAARRLPHGYGASLSFPAEISALREAGPLRSRRATSES